MCRHHKLRRPSVTAKPLFNVNHSRPWFVMVSNECAAAGWLGSRVWAVAFLSCCIVTWTSLNVYTKCWCLSINFYGASSPEYRSINFNCCRNFRFYKGMSQGKLTCNYMRTVGDWFTLRANTLFSTFEQSWDPPHSADCSSPWCSEFEIRADKFIVPPSTRSH